MSRRLIETWDVLKFCYKFCVFHGVFRLIETWDVLKLSLRAIDHHPTGINRNMGCIEMSFFLACVGVRD